jgi:hypothetical protein
VATIIFSLLLIFIYSAFCGDLYYLAQRILAFFIYPILGVLDIIYEKIRIHRHYNTDKITLMERNEVRDRLIAGENALDLAIEKQERVSIWLYKNKQSVNNDDIKNTYYADTCPLCTKMLMENQSCNKCFMTLYDKQCKNPKSVWMQYYGNRCEIDYDLFNTHVYYKLIRSSDKILDTLIKIKKLHEEDLKNNTRYNNSENGYKPKCGICMINKFKLREDF